MPNFLIFCANRWFDIDGFRAGLLFLGWFSVIKLPPISEPELSAQTSAKLASYLLSSKIRGLSSDMHCHLGFYEE